MMHNERIEQSLAQLQLKGMLDACQANNPGQSMTSQQWETWLLGLLEAEIVHRQTRSYAYRLTHKALQHDFRITFYRFNDLARRLISAREHRLESKLMEKLMRFHLLVIDELGYVPIDKQAGALLFELFSGMYEKGSLMITTHLAFDEWQDIFGHKKSTKTLIDRITHHCHLLETGNDSWRLKEGKMTKK